MGLINSTIIYTVDNVVSCNVDNYSLWLRIFALIGLISFTGDLIKAMNFGVIKPFAYIIGFGRFIWIDIIKERRKKKNENVRL